MKLRCGVYRPYVYDTLRKLIDRGLVSSVKKSGKKYFIASHPKQFYSLLDSRMDSLKNAMPELEKMYKDRGQNYTIEVFEGKEGLRAIYEQGFAEALAGRIKEYYAISITPKSNVLLKYYIPYLLRKIKKFDLAKGVDIRTLANYDLKDKPFYIKDFLGEKVVRYLPKELKMEAQFMVAGDKFILSSAHDRKFFIRIQNQAIADSFKRIFRLMWDACRESKKRGA